MVGVVHPRAARAIAAKGISHHLLEGAVEFARAHGAPAIEGYPVDNKGAKVDLTMAYVGTREPVPRRPGSRRPPTPTRCWTAFPRVVMRLDLR